MCVTMKRWDTVSSQKEGHIQLSYRKGSSESNHSCITTPFSQWMVNLIRRAWGVCIWASTDYLNLPANLCTCKPQCFIQRVLWGSPPPPPPPQRNKKQVQIPHPQIRISITEVEFLMLSFFPFSQSHTPCPSHSPPKNQISLCKPQWS